jgi:hypothetical protein
MQLSPFPILLQGIMDLKRYGCPEKIMEGLRKTQ